MSAHALEVMAAMERAEARRMVALSAPHFYVPMPNGRCNLCNLWTSGPRHLLDQGPALVASVLGDRVRRSGPRLVIPLPLRSQVLA